MKRIELYQHPFSGGEPEIYIAENLGEWLLAHYGEVPPVNVYVYVGHPSHTTSITGNVPKILANDEDVYTILEAPGLPAAVVTWLINFAIATVLSAIVNSMFASDNNKALDNRSQESPNNQLSSRDNKVRLMERVEDVFGEVRSIPSVIMQTYTKYINNRKVEYGLYNVSRGYVDVSDVRDGETLLSSITGASAAVYWPFTSPNSADPPVVQIGDPIIDGIVNVSSSSTLDGIVLKAPNQIQLTSPNRYIIRGPGVEGGLPVVPATSNDVVFQIEDNRNPNFSAVAEVGHELTYDTTNYGYTLELPQSEVFAEASTKTYSYFGTALEGIFRGLLDGSSITVSGWLDPTNNGVKTVVSHTDDTVTVAEILVDETNTAAPVTFGFTARLLGTRVISAVGNGYVELAGPSQFPPYQVQLFSYTMTATVDNDLTDWTDWFTLPNEDRTEVWTNVAALQGMYKDDGGNRLETSVVYEVQIEQLDEDLLPTGVVETVTGSVSGATANERGETLERVTGWVGPARVRARRTTPHDFDFDGFVNDEITWVVLNSVSPVTKNHFGNKTIIHTVTHATPAAAAVQRRQLNCWAARLIPTYNGSVFSGAFDADGALASGTIHPTKRAADILAAVTVDPMIGNRAISDLDMAQVWGVQMALESWHAEVGNFSYTFDKDGLSYEETVMAIAGAVFCKAYRQNGVIRLALDRPQSGSVGVFTHRNKEPDLGSETITRTFANDSDYDGVELSYMDPDTESMETIRLPLDGSYTKLKRFEVTGLCSYPAAWFRANREYARLLNERVSIETSVTVDARAVLPNSRVDIVDNTRFKSWDGEVVGQSGLEVTLSRAVEFLPSEPHSIIFKKRDGSVMVLGATAGSAANKVVLSGAPPEALVTDPTPEQGIRTIFSLAADVSRLAQSWLVQEISLTDNNFVRLVGVNYSDEYYAMDSEAVPPKDDVIN